MKQRNKKLWSKLIVPVMVASQLSVGVMATPINTNVKQETEVRMQMEPRADYIQDFNNGDISNWKKRSGDGTIAAENGQLSVQAGGASANTYVYDENSPMLKDGIFEVDLIPQSGGNHRFSVLFRFDKNNGKYSSIGYDGGTGWIWEAGGTWGNFQGPALSPGKTYKLKIAFKGKEVKVWLDGALITNQVIPQMEEIAGHIGFRAWGYPGNYSHMHYDNIKYSSTLPVEISPKQYSSTQGELASKDVVISMDTTGDRVKELTYEGAKLVAGTDYEVVENTIVIKKEFLGTIEKVSSDIEIVFIDDYTTKFNVQVKIAEEAITYRHDFKADGMGAFQVVSGNGNPQITSEGKLKLSGNAMIIDQNAPEIYNGEVEFEVSPENDNANIGVVFRYQGPNDYVYVGANDTNTNWVVKSKGMNQALGTDTVNFFGNRKKAYKVKVRYEGNKITLFVDGNEVVSKIIPGISFEKGKVGFMVANNAIGNFNYIDNATVPDTVVRTPEVGESITLESEAVSINMAADFPSVRDYTFKATGEKLYGQEVAMKHISVNNTLYAPEVTMTQNGDSVNYAINVPEIGVSFDVVYELVNNVLEMKILNIDESQTKVYTIDFPDHSLLSVRSNQTNPELHLSYNSKKDGVVDGEKSEIAEVPDYASIAIVTSGSLAGTVYNEAIQLGKELKYQTFGKEGYNSIAVWNNEFIHRGLDGEIVAEVPGCKVAITADRNGDGVVDWQDGAIAYRDDVKSDRYQSDLMKNTYTHIGMEFASLAQYPFTRMLDNLKKFYAGTDGFGQTFLIKGYQNEGHDSGHPDYADINKRAGGVEDFNVLLDEAEKFNAKVGVHINHTESYPEASSYGPDLVSSVGGWAWLDSSKKIIRENDILSGHFDKRMSDLKTLAPGIDFVYVDVYFDTRWPAHNMTQTLLKNDWAVFSEYTGALNRQSIWSHHNYEGNSQISRFINHEEQDVFGGNNLFRGSVRTGFNGWSGDANYNRTINDFYTRQLPYRYLMHFPVMKWESNKITFGDGVVSEMVSGQNVITREGKVIAKGNQLFVPWNPLTEEKIYHWNDKGGASTWELPDSWSGKREVLLYELSDTGRIFVGTVPVVGGEVTLEVKANTAYVVYPNTPEAMPDMEWGKGSKVADMGFDSKGFDYWTKSSTAENTDHITVKNTTTGNSQLEVVGTEDAYIEQSITGLEGGKRYTASAWVEVSDGREVTIGVKDHGTAEVTNYTNRTNVKNQEPNKGDKNNTYYQRMKVTFDVPEGQNTGTFFAKVAKGEENSWAHIDDIRIIEIEKTEDSGYDFYENFENVDEGWGPFVAGSPSSYSHLAQTHLPYTTDTINGEWSFKVRSETMKTMAQTLRLDPESTYQLGFDYKAYNDAGFTLNIKSDKAAEAGDTEHAVVASYPLTSAQNQINIEFTTGNYDDYYIELKNGGSATLIVDDLGINKVEPELVITKLEPAEATTVVNVAPVLPEKVMATFDLAEGVLELMAPETTTDSGITVEEGYKQEFVAVTWDEVDPVSYTEVGTFTVQGTVEGTDLKAVCNVTVVEKPESNTVKVTLQGEAEVVSGESFEVLVGVDEVTEPLYAGDFTVHYNKDVFKLDKVQEIAPTMVVGEQEVAEGIMRVLAATEGGTLEKGNWFKLLFTATETETDKVGNLSINPSLFGGVVEGQDKVKPGENVSTSITVKAKPVVEVPDEDVNDDEKIDIADLALIAYYYQAKAGEPNWDAAKKADVNKDGKVDLQDLTQVASKILGQ